MRHNWSYYTLLIIWTFALLLSYTQLQDDVPAGQPQRATPRPTTCLSSFSSPPMRFYNDHTTAASSPSLQLSPSDGLRSPAASFVSPASSLIHTTPVPPPAPPPHEEQPEHIDRLLEEVMMGLDILPNNSTALHPQPPVPDGFSTYTSSSQTMEKQQGQVSVERRDNCSSSANNEVPVLRQQGQGELNEMLEHFLLSFEKHVDSCAGRDEVEVGGFREAPVRSSQITRQQQNEARRSQGRKASARSDAPPKLSENLPGKVREPVKHRRKKKQFNQYMFPLERKKVRVRVRKPALLSDAKSKMVHDQGDKLQQMPVVKLERSGPLPVRVKLQGDSCQTLEVKVANISKTSLLMFLMMSAVTIRWENTSVITDCMGFSVCLYISESCKSKVRIIIDDTWQPEHQDVPHQEQD